MAREKTNYLRVYISSMGSWVAVIAIIALLTFSISQGLRLFANYYNSFIEEFSFTILDNRMNEAGFEFGTTVDFANAESVKVCKALDWRIVSNLRNGPEHIYCKIAGAK